MTRPFTTPRIVLLRPRNADNLGAVARAMKNFGLTDWVVVTPNPLLLEAPGVNRLAVKAGDLLESVRRVNSLAEAVADCSWVVATTMRRIDGRTRVTPQELAREAAARQAGRWALVFGDERSGLDNDDIVQCHGLSYIPSSGEQPSLNLAQAVMVYAYELAIDRAAPVAAPGPAPATDDELRKIRHSMELGLEAVGFLRQAAGEHHALDDLFESLARARLSKREAALWSSVMRVIAKRGCTTTAARPSRP